MRKNYQSPCVTIILLSLEDIVCASRQEKFLSFNEFWLD